MKATIDVAPYPSPPVELVSAYWARRSGKQIMPHPALYPPIHHPSDPPQINSFPWPSTVRAFENVEVDSG